MAFPIRGIEFYGTLDHSGRPAIEIFLEDIACGIFNHRKSLEKRPISTFGRISCWHPRFSCLMREHSVMSLLRYIPYWYQSRSKLYHLCSSCRREKVPRPLLEFIVSKAYQEYYCESLDVSRTRVSVSTTSFASRYHSHFR